MFIFSLQEEDVRAYAAEHPYHVVDSRVSNYSKVPYISYKYRAIKQLIFPFARLLHVQYFSVDVLIQVAIY